MKSIIFWRPWALKSPWARVGTALGRSVREPIDVFFFLPAFSYPVRSSEKTFQISIFIFISISMRKRKSVFTDHTLAHPLNCRGGVVARLSA